MADSKPATIHSDDMNFSPLPPVHADPEEPDPMIRNKQYLGAVFAKALTIWGLDVNAFHWVLSQATKEAFVPARLEDLSNPATQNWVSFDEMVSWYTLPVDTMLNIREHVVDYFYLRKIAIIVMIAIANTPPKIFVPNFEHVQFLLICHMDPSGLIRELAAKVYAAMYGHLRPYGEYLKGGFLRQEIKRRLETISLYRSLGAEDRAIEMTGCIVQVFGCLSILAGIQPQIWHHLMEQPAERDIFCRALASHQLLAEYKLEHLRNLEFDVEPPHLVQCVIRTEMDDTVFVQFYNCVMRQPIEKNEVGAYCHFDCHIWSNLGGHMGRSPMMGFSSNV